MGTPKIVSVIFLMVIVSVPVTITSCNKIDEETSNSVESDWFSEFDWANNLELLPHSSINQKEFERQYEQNKEWWDKSFDFLKTTNLDTITKGRYIIDEGNVTAFVLEGEPNRLEQIKWETHDNFTDLQYIYQGRALMGIAPRDSGTVIEKYDKNRDVTFYEVEGEFFKTEPKSFFLFFPTDIHRPAIRIEDYDTIKRILIKIRSVVTEEI